MARSCYDAEQLIERALDGTIAPRQERQLQRHLARCQRCRQRYARQQRALEAMMALPPPEPPTDMPQRVLAALPALSPRLLGRLAEVLRRAAADPDLRRDLRTNPHRTLLSMHVALPPGLRVEVVSQQPAPLPTPEVLYLPLPETPLQLEQMEERLAAMGLGALFGFWW